MTFPLEQLCHLVSVLRQEFLYLVLAYNLDHMSPHKAKSTALKRFYHGTEMTRLNIIYK